MLEPIIRLNAGIAAVALKYDGDEQFVKKDRLVSLYIISGDDAEKGL